MFREWTEDGSLDECAAWDLDQAVRKWGEAADAALALTKPEIRPILRDPGKGRAWTQVPVHTLAEVLSLEDTSDPLGLDDEEVAAMAADIMAGPVDWATWGIED